MNRESEQLIRQIVREELDSAPPAQPVQNVTINNYDKEIAALEAAVKEIRNLIPEDDISRNPSLNYTTRADYQGQEVKFTLFGQVLTPDEAAQFGNINYIEFGGEGGGGEDFAFKLYTVTLPTDPPQARIAIVYGEVNEEPPIGIDGLLAPANGESIYIAVNFNSDGLLLNSVISFGPSLPANTATTCHVLIGKVSLVNNVYSIDRQALLGDIIIRRYNICENGEPAVDYIFLANKEAIEL